MSVRILVLIVCVHWSSATVDRNYILSELQRLCPFNKYCHNNTLLPLTDIPPGRTSCCTGCSCEDDCEDNCCFPKKKYRSDVDYQRETCRYMTAKPPPTGQESVYKAYYIVTKPPKTGCVNNHLTTTDKSENVFSDLWGYFSPVLSNTTGKIYLNRSMALCYGDKQLMPFQHYILCNGFRNEWTSNRFSTYLSSMNNQGGEGCINEYVYKGNPKQLAQRRCYPNLITTCRDIPIRVDQILTMTNEEIRSACTSGLSSPYLYEGHYANPFCALCNGHQHEQQCPTSLGPKTDTYSALLAINHDIDFEDNVQLIDQPEEKMACKYQDISLDSCRQILCPDGHVRAANGTCIWPMPDFWLPIDIKFILKPNEKITIHELRNITAAYNESLNWIISPFAHKIHNTVAVFEKDSEHYVDNLRVIFRLKERHDVEKGIPQLLKSISNTLTQIWEAHLLERRISFNVSLGGSYEVEPIPSNDSNTRPEFPKFERLVSRSFQSGDRSAVPLIHLSKMFICEQVELEENEYSLFLSRYSAHHLTYHYNSTKKVLLEFEFTINNINDERKSVKICVDDADLNIYYINNHISHHAGSSYIYLLLLLIFLYSF